ncbi:WbqC family protein [Adhaeribacter pallidiroseus]|nr:WbqC family protein [Adhaeribacter pallidiroseus]
MQPYLFPYVGYFQLIQAVDKFVLFDDVQYIKKGWINRNFILVNGKATMFTVPLQKASQNKLINEIKIADEVNWKEKLLKTVECAYRKADHFDTVFPLLVDIISVREENISKLIYFSLNKILKYLEIHKHLIPSSTIYDNNALKAQHRIINICLKEKALVYLNAIGGKELYDKETFEQHQLKLGFVRPVFRPYTQFSAEFLPGLSIIDVLMHNSPEQVVHFFKEYMLEDVHNVETFH